MPPTRSPAREQTIKTFRARSVRVQWEAETTDAPLADELREIFCEYGEVSTVRVKERTALVLFKDADAVPLALASYRGKWAASAIQPNVDSRASSRCPSPVSRARSARTSSSNLASDAPTLGEAAGLRSSEILDAFSIAEGGPSRPSPTSPPLIADVLPLRVLNPSPGPPPTMTTSRSGSSSVTALEEVAEEEPEHAPRIMHPQAFLQHRSSSNSRLQRQSRSSSRNSSFGDFEHASSNQQVSPVKNTTIETTSASSAGEEEDLHSPSAVDQLVCDGSNAASSLTGGTPPAGENSCFDESSPQDSLPSHERTTAPVEEAVIPPAASEALFSFGGEDTSFAAPPPSPPPPTVFAPAAFGGDDDLFGDAPKPPATAVKPAKTRPAFETPPAALFSGAAATPADALFSGTAADVVGDAAGLFGDTEQDDLFGATTTPPPAAFGLGLPQPAVTFSQTAPAFSQGVPRPFAPPPPQQQPVPAFPQAFTQQQQQQQQQQFQQQPLPPAPGYQATSPLMPPPPPNTPARLSGRVVASTSGDTHVSFGAPPASSMREHDPRPLCAAVCLGFGGAIAVAHNVSSTKFYSATNQGFQQQGAGPSGSSWISTKRLRSATTSTEMLLLGVDQDTFPGPLVGAEAALRQHVDVQLATNLSRLRSSGVDSAGALMWTVVKHCLEKKQRLPGDAFLVDLLRDCNSTRSRRRTKPASLGGEVAFSQVEELLGRTETNTDEAVKVALSADQWALALGLCADDPRQFAFVLRRYAEMFDAGSSTRACLLLAASSKDSTEKALLFKAKEEEEETDDWRLEAATAIAQRGRVGDRADVLLVDLGDRLLTSEGGVLAAHLCYLLAGLSVSSERLELVGCTRSDANGARLVEATRRAEVFEALQCYDTSQQQQPLMVPGGGSLSRSSSAGSVAGGALVSSSDDSRLKLRVAHAGLLAEIGDLDSASLYCAVVRGHVDAAKKQKRRSVNPAVQTSLAVLEDRIRKHCGAQYDNKVVADAAGMIRSSSLMGKFGALLGDGLRSMAAGEGNSPDVDSVSSKTPPLSRRNTPPPDMLEEEEDEDEMLSRTTGGAPFLAYGGDTPLPAAPAPERALFSQTAPARFQQAADPTPVKKQDIPPHKRRTKSPLPRVTMQQPEPVPAPLEKPPRPPPVVPPVVEPVLSDKAADKKQLSTSTQLDQKPSWFQKKWSSIMFPDAKIVDLSEQEASEQCYYDENLERWIFPTADGAVDTSTSGPPPPPTAASMMQMMTAPQEGGSPAAADLGGGGGSADSLAALMAPPSRARSTPEMHDPLAALTAPPARRKPATTKNFASTMPSSTGEQLLGRSQSTPMGLGAGPPMPMYATFAMKPQPQVEEEEDPS